MKQILRLSLLWMTLVPSLVLADEPYSSNFIENLPTLTASSDDSNLLEWTREGLNVAGYPELYVPQPYILLSEENKYRGLQPDQMKLLADRLGAIFRSRFDDIIGIKSQAGPGVMVMNIAITNLVMKKKRGLLAYSPTGALLHAVTANNKVDLEKLASKVKMKGANLEIEFVDGATGELLAVRILTVTGKEDGREDQSWDALRREISELTDRFYVNYSASLRDS